MAGWQVADGVTCSTNLLASIFHSRASHCLTGGGKAIFVEGRASLEYLPNFTYLAFIWRFKIAKTFITCLRDFWHNLWMIFRLKLNCLWNVDVFANNMCNVHEYWISITSFCILAAIKLQYHILGLHPAAVYLSGSSPASQKNAWNVDLRQFWYFIFLLWYLCPKFVTLSLTFWWCRWWRSGSYEAPVVWPIINCSPTLWSVSCSCC